MNLVLENDQPDRFYRDHRNSQGKQVYNLTKNLDPVLKQLASAKGNIVKRKEILDRKQKEISDRNVASNKTKETMKSEYGIFTKQSEILDKNVVALNDLQETLRTKRTKEIDLEKTRLVKFDKEVGELEDMIVESENKVWTSTSKLTTFTPKLCEKASISISL